MSADRALIVGSFMRNPLFGDFTLSELERVAAAFFVKSFSKGTLVLKEEESNEGLGMVAQGRLCSTKTVPNFGEKELSTLVSGDLIGEVSLVDDLPHAANVRAMEEALLILAPRHRLARVFEESFDVKAKFYGVFTKTISRHLRDVNDRLTTFFQQSGGLPPMGSLRDMQLRPAAPMGQERVGQILRGFELFRSLSDHEVELLTSVIREVPLGKDEVVFREGARGDSLYLVAQGAIRISKFFPGVGEEALTVLAPGEFFGDMSLFDDKPRSATAIGNAEGTLLFAIAKGSIEDLLHRSPEGASALLELLARIQCKRLRNTINTVSFWQILIGQAGDVVL